MKAKILYYSLMVINLLNLFCLLVYFFPHLFNYYLYPISFLILIFLISSILISAYFLRKKKFLFAGLSIFILIINLHYASLFININVENTTIEEENKNLKIISLNTSFFKVPYLFTKAYYTPSKNVSGEIIREFLLNSNADIICLQEFLNDENYEANNMIRRFKEAGYFHHFFLNKPKDDNGIKRGIATFSKHPIIDKKVLFLSENNFNGAILTNIKIENDTIDIINVHLESNEFPDAQRSIINMTLNTISSYFHNYRVRAKQYQILNNELKGHKSSLIMAGDFNSLASNPELRKMIKENDLKDSFSFGDFGFGSTLNFKTNIPLRIDYFLVSNKLFINNYDVIKSMDKSDHFPIMLDFSLNNEY
jgi:endonuclease/exonuclease/phosphatase family metal-dependent hydrolase